MNEHRRFRELSATALDFALSTDEAQQLAAHARGCLDCRRYAADLRADQALVRSRRTIGAPDRVRLAVIDAATRPAPRPSLGWLLPIAAAAVMVFAVLARLGWVTTAPVAGPQQLSAYTWSRLGGIAAFNGGLILRVGVASGQLAAVGGIPGPTNAIAAGSWGAAGVWLSADGRSWRQLPADSTFANFAAIDVAAHDDALAVLGMAPARLDGTLGTLRIDPHVATPTFRVWLAEGARTCVTCSAPSSGGLWRSVLIDPPFGAGAVSFFTDLAAGGPGFVLVGDMRTTNGDLGAASTPAGAVVATSRDGTDWTFNDPTSPEFAGGTMQAVTDGPAGLVAVGDTGIEPSVWLSVDGTTWARLPGAIPSTSASIRAIAASPDGYVAVGDDQGLGRSWVSADGRAWQTSPTPPDVAGRVLNVTWLGSEFIAAGVSQDGTGVAWHSPNGLAWSRLDIASVLPGNQVQAVGAIGGRIVLFGFDSARHLGVAVGEAPAQP